MRRHFPKSHGFGITNTKQDMDTALSSDKKNPIPEDGTNSYPRSHKSTQSRKRSCRKYVGMVTNIALKSNSKEGIDQQLLCCTKTSKRYYIFYKRYFITHYVYSLSQ